MTLTPSPLESGGLPRRRSSKIVRWALGLLVLVIVFGLGVAVGQALEDRPQSGEPVTNISTIQPWTQTQP